MSDEVRVLGLSLLQLEVSLLTFGRLVSFSELVVRCGSCDGATAVAVDVATVGSGVSAARCSTSTLAFKSKWSRAAGASCDCCCGCCGCCCERGDREVADCAEDDVECACAVKDDDEGGEEYWRNHLPSLSSSYVQQSTMRQLTHHR